MQFRGQGRGAMSIARIIFEHPEGWLSDISDPISGQHCRCKETFHQAAHELGLDIETRISRPSADFAPRVSRPDTILVSMHTVGIAPNVARLKESYLPGYYYLDRTGFSGWAELAFNVDLQTRAASKYNMKTSSVFLDKVRAEKLNKDTSK